MPRLIHAFRRRLTILIVLLAVAVGASIAVAIVVAQDARKTVGQLANIELEAAMLARQFRIAVDDLHGALLRLGIDPPEDSAVAITQRRERLERWLTQQLGAAHTVAEQRILQRLESETRAYFLKLDGLVARPESFAAPLDRAAIVTFDDEAIRLQSLADEFAAVHDAGLRELLEASLGSVVWLRDLVFGCLGLLLAAAGVLGWLIYRDVVRPMRLQLVENEVLLAQREKLAALGTLAAGVAHEIRNPLTAIKARLYTLRRAAGAGGPQEDLRAISGEIDRLEIIVRDVLGYARPAEPTLTKVELAGWLREFAAFVEPGLKRAAIELVVDAADSVEVQVDAGQLRQIALNLVRNAEEAFEGGRGRITLAVTRERANAGDSKAVAVFSVTDNGPGVPVNVQPRLFDPFFTTKAAGTGLGLSVVARLVQNHGGEIVFQTGPGAGTRFAVRFPLVESTAQIQHA